MVLGPAFLIWKPPGLAWLAHVRVEWGFPGALRELGRAWTECELQAVLGHSEGAGILWEVGKAVCQGPHSQLSLAGEVVGG